MGHCCNVCYHLNILAKKINSHFACSFTNHEDSIRHIVHYCTSVEMFLLLPLLQICFKTAIDLTHYCFDFNIDRCGYESVCGRWHDLNIHISQQLTFLCFKYVSGIECFCLRVNSGVTSRSVPSDYSREDWNSNTAKSNFKTIKRL